MFAQIKFSLPAGYSLIEFDHVAAGVVGKYLSAHVRNVHLFAELNAVFFQLAGYLIYIIDQESEVLFFQRLAAVYAQ